MYRRTFLKDAAAGLTAAALSGAIGASPNRIIDAHTHFYDPTRPQGVPWSATNKAGPLQADLPRLLPETRG